MVMDYLKLNGKSLDMYRNPWAFSASYSEIHIRIAFIL